MPGLNGAQVAQRLASLRPNMRVLLMSGHTDHPALKDQAIPTAAALLRKPFTPHALAAAVRKTLDGEPSYSLEAHQAFG